jgi:hypothetical protein
VPSFQTGSGAHSAGAKRQGHEAEHLPPYSAEVTALPCSLAGSAGRNSATPYYGKLIGTLQEYAHKIRGTAYAVDESTIFIKGFNYDGTGPGEWDVTPPEAGGSMFLRNLSELLPDQTVSHPRKQPQMQHAIYVSRSVRRVAICVPCLSTCIYVLIYFGKYSCTCPFSSADAFFWVGNSTRPSPEGYIVPYPEDYKGR